MKAITYRNFGPAAEVLTLEEMEPPRPGAGEVLVDVALSGVNPSDVKARAGARAGVTELPYPVIVPHSDGSGVISAVGEGVDPARIGQRVWLWNGQWRRAMGTCAEQIALPSDQAVLLPEGVSLETGAVLGIPGLTASHVVFSGGPVAGQTVLVHGGAGTVGYLAVQLAKWGGARVIATAGGGAADRVREAGADAVLDYADPDLAATILNANKGQPVNRIVEVEFGVNAATDAAVIAENGRINAYGSAKAMAPELPFYPLMFKAVTLEMALVYLLTSSQRAAAIGQLHAALAAGALRIPVQKTYTLDQSAAAHVAVEKGGRHGAILVQTAT
ncbi:NADPH:quinone reductase [Ruegeria sp. WL0004]|uniref:NADPH:quinone reductase n=1 Tax=Ruegeria marisflavi TaxID=2984152 RepID=A0ABT2WS65_9RHOB|nr:NADPH:quinone reductase [Ruegeria sp. WL0004]MCU9838742.1 NADPH:quinone reductase [Ruegeria sp. WL0004]